VVAVAHIILAVHQGTGFIKGVEFVIAEYQGGITEKLSPVYMVPAQGRCQVPPEESRFGCGHEGGIIIDPLLFVLHVQLIAAMVDTEIDAILVRELVIDLGINVVEKIAGGAFCTIGLINLFDDGTCKHIIIGPSSGNNKGGLVLDNGALQSKFGSNESDGSSTVHFLHIPFLHADVHHRAEPSPVMSGKTTLGKCNIGYGIGIEY